MSGVSFGATLSQEVVGNFTAQGGGLGREIYGQFGSPLAFLGRLQAHFGMPLGALGLRWGTLRAFQMV